MVLYNIFYGISLFLQVLYYALLIYCILSWIYPFFRTNATLTKIMMALARFTDPLLQPIRRLQFRFFPRSPLDFSALILFLLLQLANRVLWWLYMLIR